MKGTVFKEGNRDLFHLTASSHRFGGMKLNYYVSVQDKTRNLQFSAITCILPCGLHCVIFMGTDESLNGWQENFSMVYRYPVPAQEFADMYLKQVMLRVSGPVILCGHSKGGNLAVYAAAMCERNLQKRIRRIYNFDGPGFCGEFLKQAGYRRILSRIRKYAAPESLIGMLLKDESGMFLVESTGHGMLQHDPYRWELFGGRLRKAQRYSIAKRKSKEALNEKICNMSKEKAKLVIEHFFAVAEEGGVEKLSEITPETAVAVLRNLRRGGYYDRDCIYILARILLYLLPGRRILRIGR